MADSYLRVRLDILRRSQNPDGGWSYYAGKQSWLEPTFYGALVLHGEPAADRAWVLLKSWQAADGSWPPTAGAAISGWGTTLCLTLAHIRGDLGEPYRKGVDYLLRSVGTESELWRRALARLGFYDPGRNLSLHGWPWKEGTSSWVEPTAQALIALKKASAHLPGNEKLLERVRSGESLLLDVRCKDGGWNYGSPWTLGEDQRSYPETTAVALLGLQGHAEAASSLDLAKTWLQNTPSSLARAWITIALRLYGVAIPNSVQPTGSGSPDLMVLALEALGAAEGNFGLLQTGAVA